MKLALFVSAALSAWAASASAGTATIEAASSLSPAPVGRVARNSLDPVPGVPIAPPRAPASYVPAMPMLSGQRAPAPLPSSNPLSVSWCQMDLG